MTSAADKPRKKRRAAETPREEAATFVARVGQALLRVAAMGVFYGVHEYFVNGWLFAMFPKESAIGAVVHGATVAAFLGIYFVLLLDMLLCFAPWGKRHE